MKMNDPFEGLSSTRESQRYFLESLSGSDLRLAKRLNSRPHSGFYGQMFLTDISQLLPYGRGLKKGFEVAVEAETPEVKNLILQALPGRYGPPRDFNSGLSTFFEESALDLALGELTFEVGFYFEPGTTAPCAFRFESVTPGSIGSLFGKAVQYLPANLPHDGVWRGLHYKRIDPRKFVTLRVSKAQRRTIQSSWRTFTALDRQQVVPMNMLTGGRKGAEAFDVSEHIRAVSELGLTGTQNLGWTGRGLFSDGLTDPAKVVRHLRFLQFKIEFRDVILAGLQHLIDIAGERMGFQAKLSVGGLRDLASIQRAEASLLDGTSSIGDLLSLEM